MQQLMGAEAKSHPQILGGAWGVLRRTGKKDQRNQRIRDTTRTGPIESTDQDSWEPVGV